MNDQDLVRLAAKDQLVRQLGTQLLHLHAVTWDVMVKNLIYKILYTNKTTGCEDVMAAIRRKYDQSH